MNSVLVKKHFQLKIMSGKFYRKERLEKQIAQIVNETLLYKMNDSRVQNELISVTRVKLSDEMNTATVYVNVLEESKKNKVIKTLYKGKSFFRHAIMQKISMKTYPELKFFIDEEEKKTTDTLNLISRIAKEMKEKETNIESEDLEKEKE